MGYLGLDALGRWATDIWNSLCGSLHSSNLSSKLWLPWCLDFLFCLNSDSLPEPPPPCTACWKLFQCMRLRNHRLLFVSHISGVTVLGCLIASVLKTIVSFILSSFLGCFREESKSGPYSTLARINSLLLFIYIIMNSWLLYILFVLVHCNHFPFGCSKYPNLGKWELLHVGLWVLLTCFY